MYKTRLSNVSVVANHPAEPPPQWVGLSPFVSSRHSRSSFAAMTLRRWASQHKEIGQSHTTQGVAWFKSSVFRVTAARCFRKNGSNSKSPGPQASSLARGALVETGARDQRPQNGTVKPIFKVMHTHRWRIPTYRFHAHARAPSIATTHRTSLDPKAEIWSLISSSRNLPGKIAIGESGEFFEFRTARYHPVTCQMALAKYVKHFPYFRCAEKVGRNTAAGLIRGKKRVKRRVARTLTRAKSGDWPRSPRTFSTGAGGPASIPMTQ